MDIYKYCVVFDWLLPQIPSAGQGKIQPSYWIADCFGPAPDGVELVDLSSPAGTGTDVGFGMRVLKDPSKLPHGIMLLKLADGAAGQTPPPGLTNNAIEDAVQALTGFGGYEISEANALLLATELFPAFQYTAPDETVWQVSDPKLVGHVLKRDITEVV